MFSGLYQISFAFSSKLRDLGILIVGIIMKVDTSVLNDDEPPAKRHSNGVLLAERWWPTFYVFT